MVEQTPIKLHGSIVWIDIATGDTVDKGRANRIILRPGGLAMDLDASRGTFSVSLKQVGELRFDGTWATRDPHERGGRAQCTLERKEDYFMLVGIWGQADQVWCGRLEAVDQF